MLQGQRLMPSELELSAQLSQANDVGPTKHNFWCRPNKIKKALSCWSSLFSVLTCLITFYYRVFGLQINICLIPVENKMLKPLV